jgi:hypothetical protein
MDPRPLCEPHQDRGFSIAATKDVAGTPMCEACFLGRPVSTTEIAGELGDSPTVEAHRRYYEMNREKVLETHRRWREARRKPSLRSSSTRPVGSRDVRSETPPLRAAPGSARMPAWN